MIRKILVVFVWSLLSIAVLAQDGPPVAARGTVFQVSAFPGSGWTALGNLSPVERGNIVSASYFEQGATVFSADKGSITLVPYGALGFTSDTYGYSWNNRISVVGGVKLNKLFRNGIVSVGGGYTYEDRFTSAATKGGAISYVQDWFGWQPVANRASRFPGSTWAVIGNISPAERNNVIALGYVNQGVVAGRAGRVAFVPYAELALSGDTQGFDWERHVSAGGGVKAALPLNNHYVEIGIGYTHERRFQSGFQANGLKIFMNASFAWRLFGKGR